MARDTAKIGYTTYLKNCIFEHHIFPKLNSDALINQHTHIAKLSLLTKILVKASNLIKSMHPVYILNIEEYKRFYRYNEFPVHKPCSPIIKLEPLTQES